ncbi:Nif11-like leader peptide family natural product precursor [Thermostichus vulcanus]|uniref:Nif11-like leader peptide family natural product n=1 Tax=Thermostichus vulcanus str. 'Rupite' TaxID=2813851 RepID=A0ABT0CCB8_THEVL|nr:Nif11-like leader peptide family natural product precursor [Thermostichus vulcanus]MCJ2543403.1 Nif11-like leader peptide family natural product precursor [Thermostichus vulcanus str. 'Rupite']
MSAQAVTEFLTKVTENEDLMKEVIQVLDAEDDREAVASLAAQKGFEFTPEELWAEVYRRQAEFSRRQDLGELTDKEIVDTDFFQSLQEKARRYRSRISSEQKIPKPEES